MTMAKTRHYPVIDNDDDVHIGDGALFLGPAKTTYSDTALESAGAITGSASFKPAFEYADLVSGSPQVLVKKEPKTLGATLTVTFIEFNMLKLNKFFGMGTRDTAVADTTTEVEDELVTLYGEYFTHLQGYDIASSPAVAVESTDATPVSYTEDDDYEIDYDNGLIRRLPDGLISDGDTISISYTWSRPAYETLSFGSEMTLNWYPLKFVVPKADGRRIVIKFWRAYPSDPGEIPFTAEDFTKFSVTFQASFDRTKPADEAMFLIENEQRVIYT
jgi:hypothetical protein